MAQIDVNSRLAAHQHDIPLSVEAAATLGMAGAKWVTLPSRPVMTQCLKSNVKLLEYTGDIVKWKMNISAWLTNYTNRSEPGYINSKYNNVN